MIVLSPEQLSAGVKRLEIDVSDTSPLAAMDFTVGSGMVADLDAHLDSLRAICDPHRRLSVVEHATATRHVFYLRGTVAAQLTWGETHLALSEPMPRDELQAALERKATSTERTQPVAIAVAHLEALGALFRVKDAFVEQRPLAAAVAAIPGDQVEELLELAFIVARGNEVCLADVFKPVLSGLFSNEIISIESVGTEGTLGEPTHALLVGPPGRRLVATDLLLLGTNSTAFLSLDAEHARRWAAHLVASLNK